MSPGPQASCALLEVSSSAFVANMDGDVVMTFIERPRKKTTLPVPALKNGEASRSFICEPGSLGAGRTALYCIPKELSEERILAPIHVTLHSSLSRRRTSKTMSCSCGKSASSTEHPKAAGTTSGRKVSSWDSVAARWIRICARCPQVREEAGFQVNWRNPAAALPQASDAKISELC